MCSVRKLLYSLISIGFLFLIVLSEHDLVCTGKNNACAGELEDSEMQGSSPNMDFFNEGNMKWPSGDNNPPGGSPVQGRNSYISVDHHTWPSSNPILTHGKLDNFICDPDSIMELTWADGTYYRGYCYHNRGYGYGEMRYSNNDIYRGYFKYGGVREGQGLFQNQYGTYDGYFMNDLPHTPPDHYGKMTYRNNAVYEGQWAEGKRHGYGKYAYYHGDSYEGEWLDDVAVGVGVVTFADGSKFEGDFGRSFKFGNKAIHKW